jgi:hypothetical protein
VKYLTRSYILFLEELYHPVGLQVFPVSTDPTHGWVPEDVRRMPRVLTLSSRPGVKALGGLYIMEDDTLCWTRSDVFRG